MVVYVLFNGNDISSIHASKQSIQEGLKLLKRNSISRVKGIVRDDDDYYEFNINDDETIVYHTKEFSVVDAKPVYRGGSQHDLFGK